MYLCNIYIDIRDRWYNANDYYIIFSPRDFVWAQNWRLRVFIKPEKIFWFMDILIGIISLRNGY